MIKDKKEVVVIKSKKAGMKAVVAPGKAKRKLSFQQEFEIMKLVLDKFLWLGFGIMVFGLYRLYETSELSGLYVMIGGAAVLVVFIWILLREFEVTKL